MSYQAKVLTVSDSVMRGERQDESGPAVARALQEAGFEVLARRCRPRPRRVALHLSRTALAASTGRSR